MTQPAIAVLRRCPLSEFVFPDIKAHCVAINGWYLIFSPGRSSTLTASRAGYDLVQNCSGMTISEAQEWLKARYGEAFTNLANSLMGIVNSGWFIVPSFGDEVDEGLQIVSLGIGVTHKCNMACRYCFAAQVRGSRDVPADMSLDTARAALDFLIDELKPPWATISLGITGEPQLRWDMITQIIEYAHRRSEESFVGLDFHITTNGLQLDPGMLEYLQTHDDMNVTLSWDGPEEVHDLQRPMPGGRPTHDVVSETFDVLRRSMRSRPSVAATVSALNPDVAGVFAHLFDSGARDLIIKPARSTDPEIAVTLDNLPAFKSGYAELAELLLKPDQAQMQRLFTIMKEDDYLGRCMRRLVFGNQMTFRCMAARRHFEIDTNGDIYPCPSLVGMADLRMGDIRNGLDQHAIDSFRHSTLGSNLRACDDCWAKYYCGGPCAYVSAVTSELGVPHEPDCELTKYLIELAGYIVSRLNATRPGLLAHVIALRNPAPMGQRPEASCYRAPEGALWELPAEAWRVADPIVLTVKEHAGSYGRWDGPPDNSARVHLSWDEEFLYIMAEAYRNEFVPPPSPDGEWWFRDGLQFGLDPGKDGGENLYPWKLPEGDYEYGVALADGEACLYDCTTYPARLSTSGEASVEHHGNLTLYRVAVPWKRMPGFIPSLGAELRFSVVVNLCSGRIRRWLQWTEGLAIRKAPARFGRLRFVQ